MCVCVCVVVLSAARLQFVNPVLSQSGTLTGHYMHLFVGAG